ncbi:MAG: hypothetical protein NC206_03780 [Bacteroides sp.]|nr:hypothetical protein [Bacteroides sp.]
MLNPDSVDLPRNQPNLAALQKTRFYGALNFLNFKQEKRTVLRDKGIINSVKIKDFPKLQGAENLFSAHSNFLRKAHKIYFQGAPVLKSPVFGPKSGAFSNHLLKKRETSFSTLRKTKMDFDLEK